MGQTRIARLHGNLKKRPFPKWQVSVTKTGATQVSDAIELLLTKYTMPKTLSNNQISAALKEIAEALNNPKLQEGFLNGNNENEILNGIVEIFDWKTVRQPRMSSSPNTEEITYVPERVNHNSKNKM